MLINWCWVGEGYERVLAKDNKLVIFAFTANLKNSEVKEIIQYQIITTVIFKKKKTLLYKLYNGSPYNLCT